MLIDSDDAHVFFFWGGCGYDDDFADDGNDVMGLVVMVSYKKMVPLHQKNCSKLLKIVQKGKNS